MRCLCNKLYIYALIPVIKFRNFKYPSFHIMKLLSRYDKKETENRGRNLLLQSKNTGYLTPAQVIFSLITLTIIMILFTIFSTRLL